MLDRIGDLARIRTLMSTFVDASLGEKCRSIWHRDPIDSQLFFFGAK